MDFTHRSCEKEIMDEGNVDHAQWLLFIKDLTWINHYAGSARAFIYGIKPLYKTSQKSQITLAELACGGGNNLQMLALWAKNKNIQFFGYDVNRVFIDYAKEHTSKYLDIQFIEQDIFSPEFTRQKFDIILCNLFCHHLTDLELVNFLKQVYQQAQLGVIINDLHRSRWAFLGFKILSFFKKFSSMVKNDGLVSIQRGFTRKELDQFLQQAGIQHYRIKWCFPFYFNITISNV